MKPGSRVLCLLLAVLLLALCACGQTETTAITTAPDSSGALVDNRPEKQEATATQQALTRIQSLGESPDDNYRVWYEIFVYSFCDSNGDGIGDLPGVISRLDYLQELGVNGIWLMPIHPSKSYHKYNVADYYAIDPAYGTMEDMEALLSQCEKRNIRVILDLVVNHTGDDHPWFSSAVEYLQSLPAGAEPGSADCPYWDYYHFDRQGGPGYNAVSGTQWYYECRFSPDMPELNWDSAALREDIRKVMEFWLNKGVAGFRLDAAKEFYSGDQAANVEVLSWIQQTAGQIKPDVYLVAEVWESFSLVADYYRSGILSLFNFPFANTDGKIVKVLRGIGQSGVVSTYATALEKADTAYRASNPDYIDAPFLSNHDVGRIAGFAGRDENLIKLAGAMNLFMSGSAFVYYGEEIGMGGSGNDPSKRAPMVWNAAGNDGTTAPPPECSLPESYPFGSLEEQRCDDSSIYNYYRQAIAIRKAIPALSHGVTTAETALNTGCVSAYRKTWDSQQCIVLMNMDTQSAQVALADYSDWTLAASLSANGEDIALSGTTLTLPAYATAVLLHP